VFLDSEERTRFAQKSHEYLIEQVQYTGASALPATPGNQNLTRITYNHPVKELVFCVTQNKSGGKNLWDFTRDADTTNRVIISTSPILGNTFVSNVNSQKTVFIPTDLNTANIYAILSNTLVTSNFMMPISYSTGVPMQYLPSRQSQPYQWVEEGDATNTSYGPIAQFKLLINGQDRMKFNSGKYFNQMQPFNHHSGNPYPGIYCYSFALKPEQHQPSGTCNFSRVDNAQAVVHLKPNCPAGSFLEMFAVNYNVLRIEAGMGGLAFSN
jgi:hypothetical protein